jgi:hypothetical protein
MTSQSVLLDQTRHFLIHSAHYFKSPMNTSAPSLPSLKSLYYIDPTIGRAVFTVGFALLAAVGIYWVSQPVPSVVKVENSPVEIWVMQWGSAVALGVAALALLVVIRRHAWLKKILTHGTPIKGSVEDVTLYEREAPKSENAPAFGGAKIRTYYTVIRYTWQGVENQVRFKLPFSPSNYQIAKGAEVDLLLLDSAPKKPVIRKVYLGSIMPRSRA